MNRLRRLVVVTAVGAAALVPLGGAAQAYHCYSDVVGDCSAVQHMLEDFQRNFKRDVCLLMEKATTGVYDCPYS